ncbi:ADP-ribosylglycohydrolase family protein [Streptomyces triculaminicus]|uniref:ADP-ribosylglycohydrolase family protein n=1 Tax=Streptomyces triculaminicus TaxID=2816232 RepID=A0A939FSE0_9ACTN|nr:ADP-ribosylglycohydrolase family protein [Streptomyces triculaminicus]
MRGCLLGGAVGDALGNPVEFLSLHAIRAAYGPAGVSGMVPDGEGVTGRVTDDTQMTLFTAEALIRADARASAKGIGGAETGILLHAYLRWLDTQQHPGPPPAAGPRDVVRSGWLREQPWLYARRAPGNACLSGLRHRHVPAPYGSLDGTPGPVNPDSKGCGTVMRSAPFGLTGEFTGYAFELAGRAAQITHGHPTGGYAAGAFAAIVRHLLDGASLEAAVARTLELLARHPRHEETSDALRQAVALAAEGSPSPEKAESLGGGWVAEEALAIAVYAALAHPDPGSVADALLLSVNHSGDSDSTGSVCGNLLGVLHGEAALPASWLAVTEGRDVIARVADDLVLQFHGPTPPYGESVHPRERYPHN